MHAKLLIPPVVALLLLAGCDLFAPEDRTVELSGVVVDSLTRQPVSGVGLRLSRGGVLWGSYPAVDRDTTGPDGRYRLRYEPSRKANGSSLILFVNIEPWDGIHNSPIQTIGLGTRSEINLVLYR